MKFTGLAVYVQSLVLSSPATALVGALACLVLGVVDAWLFISYFRHPEMLPVIFQKKIILFVEFILFILFCYIFYFCTRIYVVSL